jgi:serine/threonine-protein kinase
MSDSLRERLTRSLDGTLTIERELGGGGMARVFVATERALGRSVVIKTLPDDAWTASALQRFRREILTAAQLQHANIVPVLSAGEADGVPYFTMPLVDGASLRERMARGPVPFGEAVSTLRDVARALAAAHAKGVVHRDIKPENILISAGAALVTDFGVAKAVTAATHADEPSVVMTAVGVSVGTPAYMAPEQLAADASLDHRADLYAWGIVAYELLSGQRPFAELSGTALMTAQIATMPPPLASVAPQVPATLSVLVMRCLAKEPSARPASTAEMLAVLEQPSGETVAAAPARATHRRTLVALGVVVVAVSTAAWWGVARDGVAVDESTIAIAPFRVGGSAPEARYLREGLGDMIVPQLQTLPGVTAVSMRTVLDRWRREAGSVDDDLDDAGARRVAVAAGAGRIVLGEVVGNRDKLTVTARLMNSRDSRTLAQVRVDGSADSVFSLATRLVASLLSIRDGATQGRLRTVLSAKPEAIAAYLRGEQQFRHGRYVDAGRDFADAWLADTTFAIAALRVDLSNGWSVGDVIPGPWLERAWKSRSRLSGSDSLLLIATIGETYPAPMPIHERIRSLESLAERSNSAEIWYTFADYLFHIGKQVDEPRPMERSLAAFRRAEALDSSFAPALEHQAMILLMQGDPEAAQRAHARQTRLDSLGSFYAYNDFMMRVAAGDNAEIQRNIRDRSKRSPEILILGAAGLLASDFAPGLPIRMDIMDSVLAAVGRLPVPPSWEGLPKRIMREVNWNAGRPARVSAVDTSDILGVVEEVFAALLVDGDSAHALRGVETLRRFVQTRPDDPTALAYTAAQFALAQWALSQAKSAEVETRLAALRAVRPSADSPWLGNAADLYARLTSAQLAAASGAANLHAQVQEIDSLLVNVPALDRRVGRTLGNLLVSRLWERAGEPRLALRALTRRDGQFGQAMYNADRMRRTAVLARQLGLPDREREALRYFVEMRVNAEPHLQPEVDRARARLATLADR